MKMLSQIASIMRGSVAGDTFTANQFAQIIVRARTSPVQPGTIYQTKIKTAFAGAAAWWKTLTGEQRQAWVDYADSLTFQGPLGSYKVPGRQVFLSNYGWALYLAERLVPGVAASAVAPTERGFSAIQSLNVGSPDTGVGYKVTGANPNPESMTVVLMNSRAFDPSRNRYKGPFISITIFAASVVATQGFTIPVTGLVADQRYFCSVRGITIDGPHRLTPMAYLTAIAETAP